MLIKQMETYLNSCKKTLDAMFGLQTISNQSDHSMELSEQFIPTNDTCVHREMVEAHNGKMSYTGKMNKGAEFTIIIPKMQAVAS